MKKLIAVAVTMSLIFSLGFSTYAASSTPTPDAVTSATEKGGTAWTETKAEPAKKGVVKITVPAGATTYTVKKGDDYTKIAKKYGLTVEQLKKLNPQLKSVTTLAVGQVVIVKLAATKPAATTKPAAKPTTTPAKPVTPAKTETPKTDASIIVPAKKLFLGTASVNNFRARGTNYSFCITDANIIFDEDGKIVKAFVDVTEVSQAKNFTNWPGATPEITTDTVIAQINGWQSKRELGDAYGMAKAAITKKEWYQQMDFYQEFFVGKTVAELRDWFNKNTNAIGKPINPATATDAAELTKVAALTEPEKKVLVDVVSGATMSLSDSHAMIIEALEKAYKNRVEIKTGK